MDSNLESYLDSSAQPRGSLHLLSIWVDLAQLYSETKVSPRDKQSNPVFSTVLFGRFKLLAFSNICHVCLLQAVQQLYSKRVPGQH